MASSQPEPIYTVFLRLPFPRGDFVDPPPVNWDSSKDEALWGIVSSLSKTEIDWNEIAAQFNVTVDFLLQQVAWLTERHASQVRAQMRKAAAAAKGSMPSPQLGSEGQFSSEPMRRTGSGGGQARAPSSLSIRKDSPLPRTDGSIPGTPMRSTPRPPATRTSSSNTAVLSARALTGSSRGQTRPSAVETSRRRLSSLPIAANADDQDQEQDPDPEPPSPGPTDSSSATQSSASNPAQSRIIRRPPRFQGTLNNEGVRTSPFAEDDDEDEDEDEPAFLPQRHQAAGGFGQQQQQHDLSATLRGNHSASRGNPGKRISKGAIGRERSKIHQSQTSDSSTTSSTAAAPAVSSGKDRPSTPGKTRPTGPLSPRRTMELAGRSPAGTKGRGHAHRHSRDSDGTPSMGSSFSDLDDASVTQSALEEALASKMGDGGTLGSLRGTISNAFKSRYLPNKQGNQ